MNEQLISFETAKLAKEKGFDIECEKCYAETEAHEAIYNHEDDKMDFPYMPPRLKSYKWLDYHDTLIAYAPTQSLLQKWIREKYKIHIEIHYWNVYYTVFVDKYGDCDGEYNSYEKALEVGLLEALKLI